MQPDELIGTMRAPSARWFARLGLAIWRRWPTYAGGGGRWHSAWGTDGDARKVSLENLAGAPCRKPGSRRITYTPEVQSGRFRPSGLQ